VTTELLEQPRKRMERGVGTVPAVWAIVEEHDDPNREDSEGHFVDNASGSRPR